MRGAPFICVTVLSKATKLDCCRRSNRWRQAKIDSETLCLRAERKLEDRGGANALEHDAIHSYRTGRHHWHRGRDVDGHGYWRNSSRVRQKHGHLRRRRSLRRTVAVEECGRLVELPRPQEDQDRIRRGA